MRTIVHTSRITIVRENGPTRKARIEGFQEPIYYGVHGGIKKFYRVDPEVSMRPRSTTSSGRWAAE